MPIPNKGTIAIHAFTVDPAALPAQSSTDDYTYLVGNKDRALLVQQADLEAAVDAVQAFRPVSSANVFNATTDRIAASTSTKEIVAANASRKGLIIHNNADSALYIQFGDDAAVITDASAVYGHIIAANTTWEMANFTWTGAIQGIWGTTPGTNKSAMVTDLS